MTGSSAMAPPKSTAKRSSEIAASKMGVRRMKRKPSSASCSVGRSRFSTVAACPVFTRIKLNRPIHISPDATAYATHGSTLYNNPDEAGPRMAAPVHVADDSATTAGKPPGGATIGQMERAAGAMKARDTP